jgi:hypothetical protein
MPIFSERLTWRAGNSELPFPCHLSVMASAYAGSLTSRRLGPPPVALFLQRACSRAWRYSHLHGKFDFSSRTGKTHFPDAVFFRGREKNLSVRPRAVRAPERVGGFHPPYAIRSRRRMCSSHIRNSPQADDRPATLCASSGSHRSRVEWISLSEHLFEPERYARTARIAVSPVTHDLRRDRDLFVELICEASRDLWCIVVVIAVKRVPVA